MHADWVHIPVEETAVDAALRGVRAAKSTLFAGFTTIRDLGNLGGAGFALAQEPLIIGDLFPGEAVEFSFADLDKKVHSELGKCF